jgi:hypothetical protein
MYEVIHKNIYQASILSGYVKEILLNHISNSNQLPGGEFFVEKKCMSSILNSEKQEH